MSVVKDSPPGERVWVAPSPDKVVTAYPAKKPVRPEPDDGFSLWIVLGVLALLFFLFFGLILLFPP